MKILKNLSIISLIGILAFLLTTCSKPKTQTVSKTQAASETQVVSKAQVASGTQVTPEAQAAKTAIVKAKSTSKVNTSENINTLMRAMGIQRFQEKVVAPDFKLKNLNGKMVSLKDYRGKFVLLNFMATWCMWCRKEMPHLQKLHNRFKNKDFAIIAVFSDREGAQAVKPFIKKTGYTFTENSGTYNSGLLDPTGRVTSMYRVTGTPTTYLIDKNGNAFAIARGYRDWSKKESFALIENLINSN